MPVPPRILFGFSGELPDDLERYQGLTEAARGWGWEIHAIHDHFESTLRHLVRANAVEAVVADFISDAWLGELPAQLPLVHAGRRPLSHRIASVAIDNRILGQTAADHLRAMGYPRLALWQPQPDPDLESSFACVIRRESALPDLLNDPAPLGLFCASDYLARRALRLARRLAVDVPARLGVLGVGDRFWDAVVAERGISSIPLPQRRLGETAAHLLRERLAGSPPRTVLLAPGPVIPRDSTLRNPGPDALRARVLALYLENLAQPPDLDAIARRVGMSRRAFETAFKRADGLSPYQRLLRLRADEASRLLRETDWTLARIGEAVGYPDPARFSAFFKQQTGHPPGAWRRIPRGE